MSSLWPYIVLWEKVTAVKLSYEQVIFISKVIYSTLLSYSFIITLIQWKTVSSRSFLVDPLESYTGVSGGDIKWNSFTLISLELRVITINYHTACLRPPQYSTLSPAKVRPLFRTEVILFCSVLWCPASYCSFNIFPNHKLMRAFSWPNKEKEMKSKIKRDILFKDWWKLLSTWFCKASMLTQLHLKP